MGNKNIRALEIENETRKQEATTLLHTSTYYEHIPQLKENIEGVAFTPADEPMYTEARSRPFNHDLRGYPCLIVRAKNTADVVKVVNFVRDFCHGVIFCVSCGAHSAKCMMNGSIVLDLVNMHEVVVDPISMTASVGGGAYLKYLTEGLSPHNLGVTVGTYQYVGVGGFTLAGGYGWLSRLYGLAADNLIEAEVVLADGRVVIANDSNEYASLIRGLRGGGGNFGVVTKFIFRVHKLPPRTFAGCNAFFTPTHSSLVDCMRSFDELVSDCPNSVSAAAVLTGGAVTISTIWVYFGDAESPSDVPVLQRATRLGKWMAVETSVKARNYHTQVQMLTDFHCVTGFAYTAVVQVGSIKENLPSTLLEELLAFVRKPISSALVRCTVMFNTLGGAVHTAGEKDLTVVSSSVRSTRYFVVVESGWKPEAGERGKSEAKAWAQETARILRQYRTKRMSRAPDSIAGNRSNEAKSWASDASRIANDLKTKNMLHAPDALASPSDGAVLADQVMLELSVLKDMYDPKNFFRQNFNIPTQLSQGPVIISVDPAEVVEVPGVWNHVISSPLSL